MSALAFSLMPALNRSVLNPGNIYRVGLSRGLRVDFITRNDETRMQLSRSAPAVPSDLEVETCLKAIDISNPELYLPKKFFYEGRNFVQVSFVYLTR